MANGLNVQGSGVFSYSVGSLYPEGASLASLLSFGAGGPTVLFGAQPSVIGTPTLNAYSFIGTAGKGYDTSVPDTVTKTMLVWAKYPAVQTSTALPMGAYNGVNTGDTIFLNHTSSADLFEGIAATASGGTQSIVSGGTGSTTFSNSAAYYLFAARFTATTAQMSYVLNGAIVNGAASTLATRYTPSRTVHVGAPFDTTSLGSVEITGAGLWTTALTDAEILQMATFFQNLKGSSVTIG
ncbi:hypothetical protein [Robbsia sp. KACC 23696]|uniref:hypothetical protein n=1 Tax=Robbsia sp. KACC 23696 TaxID=3149231 RepID=UPI00325C281B